LSLEFGLSLRVFTSPPVALDPNVSMRASCPMPSYPHCMRMRTHDVAATDPYPTSLP
jgi:hypothetical protein